MADLSALDKAKCEKLFDMSEGYVLDFNTADFDAFVADKVGIDTTRGDYGYLSKAKKLRLLFRTESDYKVGKLILDLCEHAEAMYFTHGTLTEERKTLLSELRYSGQNLMGAELPIELPNIKEDTLESLMDDIKHSLARNAPEFVLDRLHTFATKMLRQLCENHEIEVTNLKGENLPLHSLMGMLAKYYEKNPILKSEFSLAAIKASISLLDKYNAVRNQQSYAHDNDVLEKIEAEYTVKIVAATLSLIDNVEKFLNKQAEPEPVDLWANVDDLPF